MMSSYKNRPTTTKSPSTFHIMVTFGAIFCIIFACCEAQVTFSKDWSAGKRSSADSLEYHTLKSAANLYHILLNQIRQLAACEARNDEIDSGASNLIGNIGRI